MGYIAFIILAIVLVPIAYVVMAKRPNKSGQGQMPIGKPVVPSEPAAEEATPDASSIRSDTAEAQRHTPAA